ncbi:segregation/condensation protein A [Thermococcus sp. M39]|uniref:segregation and condensation protein A n=1 Tax=unclassified Thermococcus TaxID=2627626 RepID=UPI001439A10D|nr:MULTISPECIES: ScpA family protein [unclassified Thermococcus]NJE07932.1 segregation/condensation protein A [Thermococcus sp. M39]NJE13630.1 segregation/condensation protein A [Thermococcus sp. LS2]
MERRYEEEITPIDILLQLVTMGKVDPWNIDIVDLTEKYIERLREMKELDLRLSARAILAASILLRMKTEALLYADEKEEGKEKEEDRIRVEVEPYVPPLRRVERYYTLDDLIEALMDALEDVERRKPKAKKKVEIEEEIFVVDDFRVDIEKHVNRLYAIVKKLYEETKEKINFWELVFDPSPKIVARTFLYLLFLANMGKIELIQEEPFGDIYVVPVEA